MALTQEVNSINANGRWGFGWMQQESAKTDNPAHLSMLKMQKMHEVLNPRFTDPVGAVLELARLKNMEGENPKISFVYGRALAKTPQEATQEQVGTWLNPGIVPSVLQGMMQGRDRQAHGGGRGDLVYYNFAIPYMAHIFPTNSKDSNQNFIMMDCWKSVLIGIDALEKTYATELTKSLTADLNTHIKANFILKEEKTLVKTFNAWRVVIKGYIELGEGGSVSLRFENYDPKDDLANILIEFQSKLEAIKEGVEENDKIIWQNLCLIVSSTLEKGIVPICDEKLSEKIRKNWSVAEITQVINKIKNIFKLSNGVRRDSKIDKLNEFLSKKSLAHLSLVDATFEHAITQ